MSIFTSVKMPKVGSNAFDLSHDVKLSFNMGELVPIACMEVVPGDRFQIQTESLLRLAPMIAPVMHKVDVYTHYFFVPNRILWPNWENFITNTKVGDAVPAPPTMSLNNAQVGSLQDYLGLPTGINGGQVSALPSAAYQLIYKEYYRDQNLITNTVSDYWDKPLPDGAGIPIDEQPLLNKLQRRAWQHDYFTSALPWPQKGDAVTLPIGQFTDVDVTLKPGAKDNGQPRWEMHTGSTAVNTAANVVYNRTNAGQDDGFVQGATADINGSNKTLIYDPVGGGTNGSTLIAQTSDLEAEAATINSLRRAFRLQEWLEKQARGGTRYVESMLVHFGVKSSDARLQRPEYLGGAKQNMVISEVLQTSESDSSPQGNMAGHGLSVGVGKGFNYRAEEHGYIIGIMSVMPKTAYQQGIPRHFLKQDNLSYYWPTFANLGEQEIQNKEIYADNTDGLANETFGYTPRYAEYKFIDSRVAGDFKGNLAYWHMGRIFSSRPNLNGSFITADPTARIFAVEDPDVDKIYAHVFNRVMAVRKMPKYGTPTI